MNNENNSKSENPEQAENVGTENLGLAGNMAKMFLHSPLSPLLLVLSLGLGILGLIVTPRQEDPQISVPMVDIFVQYPGASSKQVASLVADPLERIMSEIPGVKHVYSASQREQAMVTVEFDVGEELGASLVKLYDKLESNMDKIPLGVSQPLVKPKGVDDVPAVTLTLWSETTDDASLRLIALEVLQRLKEVPNTSQGYIVGGRTEQVRVEVMPERLAGYGISLDQIANTVRSANNERGVGSVESANQSFKLYTGAYFQTAHDVEQLIVGIYKDQPVYLRDIANVFRGPSETTQLVNYYTGPANSEGLDNKALNTEAAAAVTLAVAKKVGSNGVTVAEGILEKVEYLKGRVIPDDVTVSVTRNYGETANDKVNELIFKLFIATIIVTILVWLTLGWRAASVVLIVIPIVILVTVFSAFLMGYTIDRVSLFALIFSIGILVDDAIVVVENIYRRWLGKGATDSTTCIDAVREVGNPTILATLTVIAALLPMGFVRGMMGPYMGPIPALGSVAMVFSLFAAFIFTPWLTRKLKPSLEGLNQAAEKEHKQSEWLENFYRKIITPLVEDRKKGMLFLGSLVIVFFASTALFATKSVRVKMMPLDNKSEFNIVVNFPEGTALPTTANLTHNLAIKLREINEVTALQSYVGTASPFNFNGLVRHYYLRQYPWQADIQVQLTHKSDRKRSSHEIAEQARAMLKPIAQAAGARIQVVEMPPGPPVLQSVVAEIYGPDALTRKQFAKDMTVMFENAKHLDDVDNYIQAEHDNWKFVIDRDKAMRYGVSVTDINRTLEMAMGDYVLGDIKQNSLLDPTLIVLQTPLAVRADYRHLGQLPVRSQTNDTLVPLAELGRFVRQKQDDVIYHKDLRPVEYVTAETVGRLAAPIYGMSEVEAQLANYISPDGVSVSGEYLGPPANSHQSAFEWGGEWTVTYETFRDMGLAFAVALILIYMLVVWEFGNFLLPGIVMAPIPLTLIGIIPGHWALNAEFTATSMIGFIALAGIIVRNSILLVDFAKHEIAAGTEVQEALIMACKARTRPILITAAALVGGSSVILFDPIFQGMAISLMWGGLVSTLLTLLIIPLGCISGHKSFSSAPVDGECILTSDADNKQGDSTQASAKWVQGIKNVAVTSKVCAQDLFADFVEGLTAFANAMIELVQMLVQKIMSLIIRPTVGEQTTASAQPSSTKATTENKSSTTTSPVTKQPVATGSGSKQVDSKAKPAAKKPAVKVTKKKIAKKKTAAKRTASKKKTARRGIRLKKDIE